MHRRLKAVDGLISELGGMEYEDYETRKRRLPESLEKGIEAAPASERTAESLPVSTASRPASRPPEYRENVDDVAVSTDGAEGNRQRYDAPPEAENVPDGMRAVDRSGDPRGGQFPVLRASGGRGSVDAPEEKSRSRRKAMLKT